jgi:hypothetical protein
VRIGRPSVRDCDLNPCFSLRQFGPLGPGPFAWTILSCRTHPCQESKAGPCGEQWGLTAQGSGQPVNMRKAGERARKDLE